ncbi:MAG: ribosomal protein S18-alanine N-acetyltransferase [Lachnospiraceae bacterium]|nr:ribosomal protein S18-alanine N-acetyltransferase [Lachnospiraceae bacterium]
MLEIRRLIPEDAARLAEMEKAIFGEEGWTEKDFLETAELSYAYYLVAVEDGVLIGCCGLRNMCGDGNISNVMVVPESRRQGIGEKLLRSLMEETRKIGVHNFTLEVRSRNYAALDLYGKLGFVQEGLRRGFYREPEDDALILWKRGEEGI